MSQPLPEREQVKVVVPNVVGLTVAVASETLIDVGLVPTYEDTKGQKITNPDPEWYVRPDGEHPEGGSSVIVASQILLIIAASTGR